MKITMYTVAACTVCETPTHFFRFENNRATRPLPPSKVHGGNRVGLRTLYLPHLYHGVNTKYRCVYHCTQPVYRGRPYLGRAPPRVVPVTVPLGTEFISETPPEINFFAMCILLFFFGD